MKIPPTAIINIIRNNLNDRYKSGFPVIKELIQNADDAFSSRVDIFQVIGLSQADHPLLQGPALVIIDNGNFSEMNAEAINCIGLSSKPDNQFAVGKFGLGLKSVFHLCEAFLYISSLDSNLHVVNPWAENEGIDRINPEWTNVTSHDYDLVKTCISNINAGNQFFCLWIPLRQKRHTNRRHPIISEYPGDTQSDLYVSLASENVEDGLLENQLAQLLPMLQNIIEINGWVFDTEKKVSSNAFQIQLEKGSNRWKYPESIAPNTRKIVTGNISIKSKQDQKITIPFSGYELLLKANLFDQLMESEKWPKYSTTDPQTGEAVEQRDNAKPHAAAIFIASPANDNRPFLKIQQAVFLPLERKFVPIPIAEGNFSKKLDITLILHGCFFVDAGRIEVNWDTDPRGRLENSESLRNIWNSNLADRGTLPVILPSLEEFVLKYFVRSPAFVYDLTTAIYNSELFKKYRGSICQYQQWVCCVEAEDISWKLLKSGESIFLIPEPPLSQRGRPFDVLPGLKEFPYLTYKEYPRLTSSTVSSSWDNKALLIALENIQVENIFTNQGNLIYLIDFLKNAIENGIIQLSDKRDEFHDRLISIANTAISKIGINKLRENKGLFKQFCSLLPSSSRLILKINQEKWLKEDVLDNVIRKFANDLAEIVVLPPDFSNENDFDRSLQPSLSAKILGSLASYESQADDVAKLIDLRSEISTYIVKNTQNLKQLKPLIDQFKLFKTADYGSGVQNIHPVLRSWEEIEKLADKNILFRYAGDGDVWVRALQSSLSNSKLVLITVDIRDCLGLENIGICDSESCVNILLQGPRLAVPERRVTLLTLLLGIDKITSRDHRLGIRYLLHANPHEIQNESILYYQADLLWLRVMQSAFESTSKLWCLVPVILTKLLNEQHFAWLKVRKCDGESVLSLLKSYDPSFLQTLDLSILKKDERFKIILNFHDEKAVLKSLCIHETTDGKLVAISPFTFIESKFPLESELLQVVQMLKDPGDLMIIPVYYKIEVYPLDSIGVIKIILAQPEAGKYWLTIIEAIKALISISEIPQVIIETLRKTKWLPTISKGLVKPDQVLHISGLDDTIFRILLVTNEKEMVSIHDLIPEIRTGQVFEKLGRIFPAINDVLIYLSSILQNHEQYRIGLIDKTQITETFLQNFLLVFEQGTGHLYMPAAEIIRTILENHGDAVSFTQRLTGYASNERYIKILNHLSALHELALGEQKAKTLQVFNFYLRVISDIEDFKKTILPEIKLLNNIQDGVWKTTNFLSYDVEGIDPADVLDEKQGLLLKLGRQQRGTNVQEHDKECIDETDYIKEGEKVSKALETFFRDWETRINNREVIGGFLCWLGDQSTLLHLAKEYLGKRTIKETREIIAWKAIIYTPMFGGKTSQEPGMHDRMTKQNFWLRILEAKEGRLLVKSIVDTEFEAKLISDQKLEHLIYFDGKYCPYKGREGEYYDYLCLRKIDPNQFEPQKLSELLKNTVSVLLKKFYYQDGSNLADYWAELEMSEQLDIEIAQDWILEAAFSYIPQLGLKTDGTFRQLIKDWEEVKIREIEVRRNESRRSGSSQKYSAELEKQKIIEVLRTRLEIHSGIINDTSRKLLEAIRRKIGREYQYKPRSILFELFQNADDAVVELGILKETEDLPPFYNRVALNWDDRAIYFAHWGRAINQIFPECYPGQGKALGYDSDLIKMLMMQISDKFISSEVETQVKLTGKFGLGFKSVFLLTDKPIVISGRLIFEIVGGLYPQRLEENEYSQAKDQLETWNSNPNQKGTVFYLPADSSSTANQVKVSDLTNEFQSLAHILVTFAKRIRRIEFWDNTKLIKVIDQGFDKIGDTDCWMSGELQPVNGLKFRVLLYKDLNGSLLLKTGIHGIEPLDAHIPAIWAMAPTESPGYGYAINADFDLDVGRAQLARASAQNNRIAKDMGERLGKAFVLLYKHLSENWIDFCEQTGIELASSPYDFWASLWTVLAEPLEQESKSDVNEILKQILGAEGCGLCYLIKEFDALPSGLPGNYKVLTKFQDVNFATEAEVEPENVFNQISEWPGFKSKVPKGHVISLANYEACRRLLVEDLVWRRLSLVGVIRFELPPDSPVSPEATERIGNLVSPEFMATLSRNSSEELREHLKTLRFKGADKAYHLAHELLVNSEITKETEDEWMRSQFAPKSRVLSDDYIGLSILFFRSCREKMSAPVEQMTEWALNAKDNPERIAVLNYILRGELGYQLALFLKTTSDLRARFENSWLINLKFGDSLLQSFNPNDQGVILGRLGLFESGSSDDWHRDPLPDDTLSIIYDWWMENKDELLVDYEKDVYPGGQFITPVEDIHQMSARTEWMKLLLLGTYHTVGRTQPRAYRNFLEDCERRNWFDVFIREDPDAEAWVNILEQYLEVIADEADPKYQYLFARQFVSIFQISSNLDIYVEILKSINHMDFPFELDQFTDPNNSELFVGSGYPIVPKFTRILGIGSCFVVRDLARYEIIRNPNVFPHCYSPVKRIRDMFAELGLFLPENIGPAGSKIIYDFIFNKLDKDRAKDDKSPHATFDKAFDIPFLMIFKNWGSINGFLHSQK